MQLAAESVDSLVEARSHQKALKQPVPLKIRKIDRRVYRDRERMSSSSPPSSSSSSSPLSSLHATREALNEVKEALQPLYKHEYQTLSTEEQLNTHENINLNIALSYSLASMFYSLLATTGEGGQGGHPIRQDLEKIRKRIERFRSLKQCTERSGDDSQGSVNKRKKPSTRINKEASARVVNKHIRL